MNFDHFRFPSPSPLWLLLFLSVPAGVWAEPLKLAVPIPVPLATPTSSPTVTSTPMSPATGSYRPPWKPEGETFLTYVYFRDELMATLRLAQTRIAIVTPVLTDGDVATALFAARVRGLQTLALLDSRESRAYNSRHEYLARAKVPTWLVPLARFRTEAVSLLVIDDSAWRVSTRFDDMTPGQVKLEASSFTAAEIFEWRNVRGARFARETPLTGGIRSGAKKPTRAQGQEPDEPVTLEGNDEKKQSGGRIPRRLPRETRLQRLQRQVQEPRSNGSAQESESTGSLNVPAPPPNETDVRED